MLQASVQTDEANGYKGKWNEYALREDSWREDLEKLTDREIESVRHERAFNHVYFKNGRKAIVEK